MHEFVVITGLSGAGRTNAANSLEDLGWFVIDNLPPALIPKISELAQAPGSKINKVVLVVGSGFAQERVLGALEDLRGSEAPLRVVFLEATSPELVRRYESTRRAHPFDRTMRLSEAIDAERQALDAVKASADVVIDTTRLNVHDLRRRIVDLFGDDSPAAGMQTRVLSFGFKHGVPVDVDMIIDCRFLPNPHWVEELRPLTGLHRPVREYVMDQPIAAEFLERLGGLLLALLPAYVHEGKSYLTVAFGCTGGRHRSVAIAEQMAETVRPHVTGLTVEHRDIEL